MKYCFNSAYLKKLTTTGKNGGAENDDGVGASKKTVRTTEPDPIQSRTRGRKFRDL